MFSDKNHVHALATVIGTMGGFQEQPLWFQKLSGNALFQILTSAILVFQGGGGLDIVYSIVVAVLFYILIEITRYISFSQPDDIRDDIDEEEE